MKAIRTLPVFLLLTMVGFVYISRAQRLQAHPKSPTVASASEDQDFAADD